MSKSQRPRLRRLLRQYNHKCYWCWEPIVSAADFGQANLILSNNAHYVTYRDFQEKAVKRIRCATVDHIIPRSQGGDSSNDNIVPSCFTCNQRRNVESQPPRKYSKKLCKKCGGLKRNCLFNNCDGCRYGEVAYHIAHGLKRVLRLREVLGLEMETLYA